MGRDRGERVGDDVGRGLTRERYRLAATVFAFLTVIAAACAGDDGDPAATADAVDTGGVTTSAPATTGATATTGTTAASSTIATDAPATTTSPPEPASTTADAGVSEAAADTTSPNESAPTGTAAPAAAPTPTPTTAAAAVRVIDGDGGFRVQVQPIDDHLRARMEPSSWRPGCPVGLDELRYLQIDHWSFDGGARTGELVVHRDVVDDVVTAFQIMWNAGFPIRQMRLIDDYGGDDFASIEADNTSAFNCRTVAGTSRWSNHATGTAIDINPLENPYVSNGQTEHPASVPYLDRSIAAPGVIVEGGAAVAAFDTVGWGWGGRWSGDLDYQHFSASGG